MEPTERTTPSRHRSWWRVTTGPWGRKQTAVSASACIFCDSVLHTGRTLRSCLSSLSLSPTSQNKKNLRSWSWRSSFHQSSMNPCGVFCVLTRLLLSECDIRNSILVNPGMFWIQIHCRVGQRENATFYFVPSSFMFWLLRAVLPSLGRAPWELGLGVSLQIEVMAFYPSRYKLTAKLQVLFEVSAESGSKGLWRASWEASSVPRQTLHTSGTRQTPLIGPFRGPCCSSQDGSVSRRKRWKDLCLLLADKCYMFAKKRHIQQIPNCFTFSQTFIQTQRAKKTFSFTLARLLKAGSTLYLITITNMSFVSSKPASHTVESLLFAVYFQREDYLILLQAENFKHE